MRCDEASLGWSTKLLHLYTKCLCYLCVHFSVVEASEFSKDGFFLVGEGAFFTPAIGVNIEVVVLDDAVFQPRQCIECKQRWSDSGMEVLVETVK